METVAVCLHSKCPAYEKCWAKDSKEEVETNSIQRVLYQYTPCYGTHGNKGLKIGECPLCHNPIFQKKLKRE